MSPKVFDVCWYFPWCPLWHQVPGSIPSGIFLLASSGGLTLSAIMRPSFYLRDWDPELTPPAAPTSSTLDTKNWVRWPCPLAQPPRPSFSHCFLTIRAPFCLILRAFFLPEVRSGQGLLFHPPGQGAHPCSSWISIHSPWGFHGDFCLQPPAEARVVVSSTLLRTQAPLNPGCIPSSSLSLFSLNLTYDVFHDTEV